MIPADQPTPPVEAYDLAALLQARAAAMGRDVVVMLSEALLALDPAGMRAWMAAQSSAEIAK